MDTYYTGPDGTRWVATGTDQAAVLPSEATVAAYAPTERTTRIEVHDDWATSSEVRGFTPYYTSLNDIFTDAAYSPSPYEMIVNEVERALGRAVLEEVNDRIQDFYDDDIKSESLEEWIKSLKVEAANE